MSVFVAVNFLFHLCVQPHVNVDTVLCYDVFCCVSFLNESRN